MEFEKSNTENDDQQPQKSEDSRLFLDNKKVSSPEIMLHTSLTKPDQSQTSARMTYDSNSDIRNLTKSQSSQILKKSKKNFKNPDKFAQNCLTT